MYRDISRKRIIVQTRIYIGSNYGSLSLEMDLECFQCFVTQQYLFSLRDDWKCIDCGRLWRVPKPKESEFKVPKK